MRNHPDERVTIAIPGVDVRLLRSLDSHIKDLVRECELVASGESYGTTHLDVPHRLLDAMSRFLNQYPLGITRLLHRLSAEADSSGEWLLDVTVRLDRDAAPLGEEFLTLLEDLDEYCRSTDLLLTVAPEAVTQFGSWFVGEIVRQLRIVSP